MSWVEAVGSVIKGIAIPYGYTLAIWSAGMLAVGRYGHPRTLGGLHLCTGGGCWLPPPRPGGPGIGYGGGRLPGPGPLHCSAERSADNPRFSHRLRSQGDTIQEDRLSRYRICRYGFLRSGVKHPFLGLVQMGLTLLLANQTRLPSEGKCTSFRGLHRYREALLPG